MPAPCAAPRRTLRALGERALLLVGAGGVERTRALRSRAAIARKTGCRVMAEFYSPRTPGGRGRTRIERLPYAVDAAVDEAQGRRVPGAGRRERADRRSSPIRASRISSSRRAAAFTDAWPTRATTCRPRCRRCATSSAPPRRRGGYRRRGGPRRAARAPPLDADVIGHALVGAAARAGGGGRRGGDLGPRVRQPLRRRSAARLAHRDGWRHRLRPAGGARRGDRRCPAARCSALEGDGSAMYTAAGAVEHRARIVAGGGDRVRQPRLPHPAGRAQGRRRAGERPQGHATC